MHLALLGRSFGDRNDYPKDQIEDETGSPKKEGKKNDDPDYRYVDVQEGGKAGANSADGLVVRIPVEAFLSLALISGIREIRSLGLGGSTALLSIAFGTVKLPL